MSAVNVSIKFCDYYLTSDLYHFACFIYKAINIATAPPLHSV